MNTLSQMSRKVVTKKFYEEKGEEEAVECPPQQDDDPPREGVSNTDRRWKFVGAFLFLLLIVLVLGITLHLEPQNEAPREAAELLEKQEVEERGEAHEPTYSVKQNDTGDKIQYKFYFNAFHFMTLIDKDGTFILRPHPGCDINGWGTSFYAQPFLPGAKLKHTTIKSVSGNSKGIRTNAFGNVSLSKSDTYGTWQSTFSFSYDQVNKEITGTGDYKISLSGPLSNDIGDLNLFKIASNYLKNVPLLSGGMGDTGDMKEAKVVGDDFSFVWIPDKKASYFPTDKTDTLSINVKEQFNNVDTAAMNFEEIPPAFKPSLKVILKSHHANTGMVFGGIYNVAKSQDFWEDNVAITPLITTKSTRTSFDFDVVFESTTSHKSCPTSAPTRAPTN
jgi:hypothetical protein